jgi:hypothetical protein
MDLPWPGDKKQLNYGTTLSFFFLTEFNKDLQILNTKIPAKPPSLSIS